MAASWIAVPAPSQWPATLHSRGLATLQSGPAQTGPFVPAHIRGRWAAASALPSPQHPLAKVRWGVGRKGSPARGACPAGEMGRFRTGGASERGQAS